MAKFKCLTAIVYGGSRYLPGDEISLTDEVSQTLPVVAFTNAPKKSAKVTKEEKAE